jgi:ectoine hydroxylase-related dioxygenase (phytanoyl-CoA dioxygenase family)
MGMPIMDALSTGGQAFAVTPDIVDAYAQDGAVLLEQPFGAEWIDRLEQAIHDIFAQYDAGTWPGDIFSQDGRFEITGAIGFHPVIRRWALDSRAAEIVGRVMGSETVRLYTDHDIAFGKRGAAETATIGATSFHIDGSAWGFLGQQIPSFWLALSDVGMTRGPLVVATGSHRKMERLILPSPTDPDAQIPEGYLPYAAMRDFLDRHDFPMKIFPARRGDVVVLNPLVVHGSIPMTRPGFRVALSTRWLGDDARWHAAPPQPGVAGSPDDMEEGAPPSDALFPIIWESGRGNVSRLTGAEAWHTLTKPKNKMRYKEFARVETQNYAGVGA